MKTVNLFTTFTVLMLSLVISASAAGQTYDEKLDKDQLQEILPGQIAPDIVALDMNGDEFSLLDDAALMPIVVDFWATWCPPCRAEFPLLNDFQKAHEGDVMVVAVTSEDDESEQDIRDYIEQNDIVFRIIHDPSRTFSEEYFIRAIPFLVVIDTDGVVLATHLGYSEDVRQNLEAELGLEPANYPAADDEGESEGESDEEE